MSGNKNIIEELDDIEKILESGLIAASDPTTLEKLKKQERELTVELESVQRKSRTVEFFQKMSELKRGVSSQEMPPVEEASLVEFCEDYQKEIAEVSRNLKAEKEALSAESGNWMSDERKTTIEKLEKKLELLSAMNSKTQYIQQREGVLDELSTGIELVDYMREVSDMFSTAVPKRNRLIELTALSLKLLMLKDWDLDRDERFTRLDKDSFAVIMASGRDLCNGESIGNTGFKTSDIFEETFVFEDAVLALFRLLFERMNLELPKKIQDAKDQFMELVDQFKAVSNEETVLPEEEEEEFDILIEDVPQEEWHSQVPMSPIPVTVPACVIVIQPKEEAKEELEVMDLDQLALPEKRSRFGWREKLSRFKVW